MVVHPLITELFRTEIVFESNHPAGYPLSKGNSLSAKHPLPKNEGRDNLETFLFLRGFNILVPKNEGKRVYLEVTPERGWVHKQTLEIEVKSQSTKPILVKRISFSCLVWNKKTQLESKVQVEIISLEEGSKNRVQNEERLRKGEIFWGISGLSISRKHGEEESDDFKMAWTKNISILINFLQCDSQQVLFWHQPDSLCYEQCPDGYYEYEPTRSCQPCS